MSENFYTLYTNRRCQKYSNDSNFPKIFHLRLHFFYQNIMLFSNYVRFWIFFISTKTEKYVIYSSYFQIFFLEKHVFFSNSHLTALYYLSTKVLMFRVEILYMYMYSQNAKFIKIIQELKRKTIFKFAFVDKKKNQNRTRIDFKMILWGKKQTKSKKV